MRKTIVVAAAIVFITFLSGMLFNLFGLNHWVSCNGQDGGIHPLTFALISGFLLTYVIWSNRNRSTPDNKASMLALSTFLFAPVLGFTLQIGIPLYKHDFIAGSDIGITLYVTTLSFLLCAGNYATTTRQNNLGGICNRWTLSNRAIWTRTQRFYGRLTFFGGLTTIPLIFLHELSVATFALFVVFIVSSLTARLYSYCLSQSTQLIA
jgi:uncharacterized membrane protein